MTTQESTIANADLWSRYFQEEWKKSWLNPLGAPSPVSLQMAEGTAARVANFLTLVAAGPIAWLYNANAPQVTEIVAEESGIRELPLHLVPDAESVEDASA